MRWGEQIAAAGFGVVTGGYSGSMEAVSEAVANKGGQVIGVTSPILFPKRVGANPFVGIELPAPSLPSRINRMLDLSCGALALPGGVGTLAEICLAWNQGMIAALSETGGTPPVGVHSSWLAWLKPGLQIHQDMIDLLFSIEDSADLDRFLQQL